MRVGFAHLGADLQFRILALLPLRDRHAATLLCTYLHAYTDPQIALLRRISLMLQDRLVCRLRSVKIYVLYRQQATACWPQHRQNICIKGIAKAWRISSNFGDQRTELKTPHQRDIMEELVRLVPAFASTAPQGLQIARVDDYSSHSPTHICWGERMTLKMRPFDAPLEGTDPTARALARIRLLLTHMQPFDSLHVRHPDARRPTAIQHDHVHKFYTVRHQLEVKICASVEEAVQYCATYPGFRPLIVEHTRWLYYDREHYIYPDFEYHPPTWSR